MICLPFVERSSEDDPVSGSVLSTGDEFVMQHRGILRSK